MRIKNETVSNEQMQHALEHLMNQFRQINRKYGLIVGEQIEILYDERKELITLSKTYMDKLEQ